jgi:hypothetical protein
MRSGRPPGSPWQITLAVIPILMACLILMGRFVIVPLLS